MKMPADTTFKYICISALGLVIIGMCLRFGGEKFMVDLYAKKYNDSPKTIVLNVLKYTGAIIYILGWLLMTIGLFMKHQGNKLLGQFILATILISVVWVVIEYKEINFTLKPQLPLISISVLLSALSSLIILKTCMKDIMSVMAASFLIIFTEYIILPVQRQYDIQDGIGLPLLILGWFILFSVFNKLKQSEDVIKDVQEDIKIEEDVYIPMVDLKH